VPPDTDGTRSARARLVKVHIEDEGVKSPAVLRAMRKVPRHWFVPEDRRPSAYEDRPLPIGEDQTISQPYVVASMTEEADIQPGERVLEIGTGSGYQAAVLAELTSEVFTIEIREPLARRAAATLKGAGYAAVKVRHADGYHGWAAKGPFDAILVTAAAPHVPPPLVRQLKPGGRMVIPVGGAFAVQDLVLVTKDAEGRVRTKSLYAVRFVPLTGSLGPKDE
jgi:protein-L-isoaspartate(D-aspartate) O-methyltransferase